MEEQYFDQLVEIVHNKEWYFKRDINDGINKGSQFIVTAILEEAPGKYVVGLYGKVNPEINEKLIWQTHRFDNVEDVFKLFAGVDLVMDHSKPIAELMKPIIDRIGE